MIPNALELPPTLNRNIETEKPDRTISSAIVRIIRPTLEQIEDLLESKDSDKDVSKQILAKLKPSKEILNRIYASFFFFHSSLYAGMEQMVEEGADVNTVLGGGSALKTAITIGMEENNYSGYFQPPTVSSNPTNMTYKLLRKGADPNLEVDGEHLLQFIPKFKRNDRTNFDTHEVECWFKVIVFWGGNCDIARLQPQDRTILQETLKKKEEVTTLLLAELKLETAKDHELFAKFTTSFSPLWQTISVTLNSMPNDLISIIAKYAFELPAKDIAERYFNPPLVPLTPPLHRPPLPSMAGSWD